MPRFERKNPDPRDEAKALAARILGRNYDEGCGHCKRVVDSIWDALMAAYKRGYQAGITGG